MHIRLNVYLCVFILTFAGTTLADNFTYPQGVYNGEQVQITELPNGGVINEIGRAHV